MDDVKFLLNYIEKLEDEIRKLKSESKFNSNKEEELILEVGIGAKNCIEINTKILVPKQGKSYYIPTDYKEPLRVNLVSYEPYQSVLSQIRVMAIVDISNTDKTGWKPNLKDVQPELLFSSKSKASDYYLYHKDDLNWEYLKEKK